MARAAMRQALDEIAPMVHRCSSFEPSATKPNCPRSKTSPARQLIPCAHAWRAEYEQAAGHSSTLMAGKVKNSSDRRLLPGYAPLILSTVSLSAAPTRAARNEEPRSP